MGVSLKLPHVHTGKVRDTYDIPGHPELLLLVQSDRLSTHNVKHLTLIPGKGELLTAQTVFWSVDALQGVETHLVAFGRRIYDYLPKRHKYPEGLHRRALVVRRLTPDPNEYIWRRYMVGSLWKLYESIHKEGASDPYRLSLPSGLKRMHRFSDPLFTPTDKSETDDPIPAQETRLQWPEAAAVTEEVFRRAEVYLARRGIILIDMKCEMSGGVLIDEWLTGDCARMAWAQDVEESVRTGTDPRWLDKEEARQIAERRWGAGPKVPLTFSDDEVKRIVHRYQEAFEGITGMPIDTFRHTYLN